MRILVTGASGFIGGTLAHHLSLNRSLEVIASGRSKCPASLQQDRITYLQSDLTSELPEIIVDVCIHCAGLADDKSSKAALQLQNVQATENLIKSLSGCKKFIFISSSSVYNFKLFPIASEQNANLANELSDYGRSKLLAENSVINSAIESIYIFRPRAVYGEGDRVLLPRILDRLKNGRFIVPGSLNVRTSLTNIQHILDACDSAIISENKGVSIFNVADTHEYNLREVFTKIGKLKSPRISFINLPVGIVRMAVKMCERLRIPISVSSQSIDYLTIDSQLETKKIKEILSLELTKDLDDFFKIR